MPRVQRWLAQRPRYHVPFTPAAPVWFNLVERWFGLLMEKLDVGMSGLPWIADYRPGLLVSVLA